MALEVAVDAYSLSDSDDEGEAAVLSEPVATVSFGTGATTVRWTHLRLGETIIEVSTEGQVKAPGLFQPASNGLPYTGTPYRVIGVELTPGNYQQYFIHDLVYQAFLGVPPPGWDVRHRTANYSNNALSNLTILPAHVNRDPFLTAY